TNSVFTAPISRRASTVFSVPSSTKETAPIWMPVIADPVATGAAAASRVRERASAAPAARAPCCTNLRRVTMWAPCWDLGQRDDFVVGDGRDLEADGAAVLGEGEGTARAQRRHPGDARSVRHLEGHAQRPDGIEAAHEATRHVGVRVVEHVQREARLRLPGE